MEGSCPFLHSLTFQEPSLSSDRIVPSFPPETATYVVVFILFLFPSTTIIPHFIHFVHKKLQKIKNIFYFLKKLSPLYIYYTP
jgi:hypothetical protein